jgi:hypothetical protein
VLRSDWLWRKQNVHFNGQQRQYRGYRHTSSERQYCILQRRARRHATINVVDFSDVTRCQNMVDDSDVRMCQNIRKVLEHMYPDKNVM